MRYARKDILDKFYTDPIVAKKLVSSLDLSYDLIVEPSAGNGSFIDSIPNILAMDICPGRHDIVQQDFLNFKCDIPKDRVLVIGNPPFGKQNNLAIKFINHAATIADTIAFILPLSFNKPSVQNKVSLNLCLQSSSLVEEDAFLFMGERYHVPTVFQIWKAGKREKALPQEPIGWKYAVGDLSIRRVGYYAGRASRDLTKNKESHLFVCLEDKSKIDGLINHLNGIVWNHDAVGPRTVSKHQLNEVINCYIQNADLHCNRFA